MFSVVIPRTFTSVYVLYNTIVSFVSKDEICLTAIGRRTELEGVSHELNFGGVTIAPSDPLINRRANGLRE